MALVIWMGFALVSWKPRPLLFGNHNGARPGTTSLKENGGDCSVYGLIPRTCCLIARGVTMRKSARGALYRLQPASQDAGRVCDKATGESLGTPTYYSDYRKCINYKKNT